MLIRSELAFPGSQVVNDELYNQLFTMHGTIMLLLFATPLFFGFGNVIMPLQIGSPDVAFPRLNMFSYWLFLFGGLIAGSGFLTPQGAADFGWFAYTPLSDAIRSPGVGGDLWIMGLWMAGLGTILGAVNFITTIICMRAPGMTMFRMPIFVWNTLVTSLLVLIAFPVLAGALLSLEADRQLGAHVFDAAHGGAILWQHLFWFFGHPEVYIIALPFFGIVTEILPVFSRKPIFGYVGLVGATLGIAILSVAVWAHHMFVTGAVDLPFFSGMTFLIAVPTGVKFFNWIGTMWGGSLSFDTPMLWSVGFLTTFLFGGLTGIILASPPLDFHVSDSYFVVAHFHYVVFGTVVFAMFAGLLLLVAQDDRADARRAPRQAALLAALRRLPHDVPGPALARRRGHAASLRRLPARRRLHHAQPGLDRSARSCSAPRRCRSSTTSTSRRKAPLVERRRPVGLGPLAGVGHQLPAAAPQLRTPSRGSARSPRPSTCTTRRSPRSSSTRTRRRATAASPTRPTWRAASERARRANGHRPTPTPTEDGDSMKAEAWIFGVCTIFLVLVTPAYWFDHRRSSRARRRLDRHVRADDDHAADPDGHPLPRLPRQEDGPAPRGPQGRRDRRRRRRAGLLPAVLLVAAVVRADPRRHGLRRRRRRLVAVHHRRACWARVALSGLVFEYYRGEHAH